MVGRFLENCFSYVFEILRKLFFFFIAVTSEKGLTVAESADGKKSEAAIRAAENTESASL